MTRNRCTGAEPRGATDMKIIVPLISRMFLKGSSEAHPEQPPASTTGAMHLLIWNALQGSSEASPE